MPFKPHPTNPDLVIYKPNEYWIPKPWQGLTQEEREAIILESYRKYNDGDPDFIAVEIEAKLKEKNT